MKDEIEAILQFLFYVFFYIFVVLISNTGRTNVYELFYYELLLRELDVITPEILSCFDVEDFCDNCV